MLPVISIVVVAYFLLYALAFSIPIHFTRSQSPLRQNLHLEKPELGPQSSFEAWLQEEEKIALDRILRNVAPGGSNAPDATPGTIIASPSREYPNYYYQCSETIPLAFFHLAKLTQRLGIRDAAITASSLVSLYTANPHSYLSSKVLSPILESYAYLSHTLQHTPNPSGNFADLSGLGEPKFHVSGTAFIDPWGRPQRDGPALRALTLMTYLRAYNASHPTLWVREGGRKNPFADLYDASMPPNSIIKADLEYVARYWRDPGFDLWEEVSGLHFFTALVQHRALREGAELAAAFGDWGARKWYAMQADLLRDELLPRFWSAERGHLIASLDKPERSGLDCGVLLGAIHGTAIGDEDARYAPYSDEVLVSLLELVRDQRKRFPINAGPLSLAAEAGEFDELAGVGIGRYPEDAYDGYGFASQGGNPWFLCTASASETLYRTGAHITSTRFLNVSSTSLPFWNALLPSFHLDAGTVYEPGDAVYHKALKRLKSTGDSFLAVVRKHADGEGALSEQFDRLTGYERGARDLTWSYGAFLQAVKARNTFTVEEMYR